MSPIIDGICIERRWLFAPGFGLCKKDRTTAFVSRYEGSLPSVFSGIVTLAKASAGTPSSDA